MLRRRTMSRKEDNSEVFNKALSVMHLDAKDSRDAKGNRVSWDGNHTVTFAPGKFGNALSSGRCWVELSASTYKPSTFTIACWVRTDDQGGDNYCSVRVNPESSGHAICLIGFNVGHTTPDSVRLLIGNGTLNWAEHSTLLGNIPMDSFYHHFEMTYSSGVITTFVDGIKYGTIRKSLSGMPDYKRIGIINNLAAGYSKCRYIDEVIYTPEILHTENFTPPSKPYNNK